MSSQPIDPTTASCAGGVPAELARMRQTVQGLVETLWAARGPDELMDTVAEIEALKSTADALLLGVIRELEATGAVKDVGWASTQDFLTAKWATRSDSPQSCAGLSVLLLHPCRRVLPSVVRQADLDHQLVSEPLED